MARLPERARGWLHELRDLSVSQKLSIGLGALLVLLSLAWLGQWAATPEMVPLLAQDLRPEEVQQVQAALEMMNEPVRVRGSRVYVRAAANRQALLAQLQMHDKLPSDTSVGFDALVREANPWISQEENNKRWTVALQTEIRRVLTQFEGVRDAYVFLNLNTQKRGFSRNEPPASAGVTLIMKNGESVPRPLALAAARLVCGAVRGLPLRNVQVVDGRGLVALDWEQEEAGTSSALERLRRELEQRVAEKIRGQIAFDPHLRVSVRVELDPTARETDSRVPTEGVETSRSGRERKTSRTGRSGQPGVQPNVGAAAGGGQSEERTEETETESRSEPGVEHKREQTAPGEVREIFAAVNVSHSALVAIFKRTNPDKGEPSLQDVEAVFKAQAEKIVNQVKKLVKPQEAEQVAVDWYYDGPQGALEQSGTLEASTGVLSDALQRYGPPSGLALLAVLALGLMFRMARSSMGSESLAPELGLTREAIEAARRAGPATAAAVPAAQVGAAATPGGVVLGSAPEPPPVPLEKVVLGRAAEGVLEAQEVDEGTVQLRNMLEQVAGMVDKDPDSVAVLISHWLDRS
jgi:flagellar biosynthesis/type III secretory pathway M-ring protein FliF/YscJ